VAALALDVLALDVKRRTGWNFPQGIHRLVAHIWEAAVASLTGHD
jgi:hypothetical protein